MSVAASVKVFSFGALLRRVHGAVLYFHYSEACCIVRLSRFMHGENKEKGEKSALSSNEEIPGNMIGSSLVVVWHCA